MKLKFFILEPESKDENDIYAEASRDALEAFAWTIRDKNPKLSRELLSWAARETIKCNNMFFDEDEDEVV